MLFGRGAESRPRLASVPVSMPARAFLLFGRAEAAAMTSLLPQKVSMPARAFLLFGLTNSLTGSRGHDTVVSMPARAFLLFGLDYFNAKELERKIPSFNAREGIFAFRTKFPY